MLPNKNSNKPDYTEISFVKKVTVGNLNPNAPFSDEKHEEQLALLNKCLTQHPKGVILGKDVSIGQYMIGEHQLTMETTTYHIGFKRKPYWLKK